MDDDTSLQRQYEEISIWLENLFGDRAVPSFEINRQTMARLYAFMNLNKEMDRVNKIVIDDLKKKTLEYSIKAHQFDQVLKNVGISADSLSQSGLRNLQILSDLAAGLKLQSSTHPSYVLAMTDVLNAAEEFTFEIKRQEANKYQLKEAVKEMASAKNSLKSIFESFEQQMITEHPIADKRKKEMQFLKGKSKEYKALLADSQAVNVTNGVSEDIYHENLKQIHQELSDIRGEINTIKCRLSDFHSLPPDMSLARVKIEEARQELHRLESDLYNDLELLNL